jgi:MYXO-CTERM domain-containing protein
MALRYGCEQLSPMNDSQPIADLRRGGLMSTYRALLAGILTGTSLMSATAALAQVALVEIQPTYPDPVVASAGDTVEVEVSVIGLEGWQACEISLPAASAEVCQAFQADFFCDDGMWEAASGDCNLSLCSCVSATENELLLAPPLSIRTIEGSPDCEVIAPNWDAIFSLVSDDGGQRLQADLPGDNSHGGVQFSFDSHDRYSAKLYKCRVDIADDAAVGVYPLPCASPSSSDPAQQPNFTNCTNGSIEVVVRPTATPTATSVPTATSTPRKDDDDNGCAVVTPAGAGSAWWLAVPALALLWRRRRPF